MQLDLEEQEQIDQIKHFWNRWGNLISWFLILVLGSYAAWNGWQWWQKRNAAQAAVLYDTVEQSARGGDLSMLERSVSDMQSRFASVTLTQHAVLLAAKTFESKGEHDKAKSALSWVAKQADDEGLAALARWRLAGLQIQDKQWDAAKESLTAHPVPPAMRALFDERMGDWASVQGLSDQARDAYQKAWSAADAGSDHRRWLDIKLAALGAQPQEK